MLSENQSRLIRLPEVCTRTGLARSTVYYLIAKNQFPSQVKISERASAWVETDVNRWIEQRIGNAA